MVTDEFRDLVRRKGVPDRSEAKQVCPVTWFEMAASSASRLKVSLASVEGSHRSAPRLITKA